MGERVWGVGAAKWLGAYEIELADIIEEIIHRGYSQILNIGCAEGYYSVGLALRDRTCEVFAFDIDPICRSQTRRLAELNQLSDRVHVRGECKHDLLNDLIEGSTLIFSDIEGYEVVLLDPAKAPKLKNVDLLIELHEKAAGEMQVEKLVTDRFGASHRFQRRFSLPRDASALESTPLCRHRF